MCQNYAQMLWEKGHLASLEKGKMGNVTRLLGDKKVFCESRRMDNQLDKEREKGIPSRSYNLPFASEEAEVIQYGIVFVVWK